MHSFSGCVLALLRIPLLLHFVLLLFLFLFLLILLFSRDEATLYEVVSVGPSDGPSAGPSDGNQLFFSAH